MSETTSLGHRLQGLFLTGLLTLLPLWLTWVVVKFLFALLSDTSRPLIEPTLVTLANRNPHALGWLDDPWVLGAIGLLATLATILAVGWVSRRVWVATAAPAVLAVILAAIPTLSALSALGPQPLP